jgi:two-component system, OmpR family, sensor kinase
VTLRARLLLGLLALATVALAAAGTVTYRELGNSLVDQSNQQLRQVKTINVDFIFENKSTQFAEGVPAGTYFAWIDASGNPITKPRVFDYPESPTYHRVQTPSLPGGLAPGDTFSTSDPHFRGQVVGGPGNTGIVIAVSMRDADHTLHRLLVVELVVCVIVLLGLALLAYWVVQLGLRPLHQMQETAGAIAAGDYSQRVDVEDKTTEVGQLGLALNEMMGKIEEAFDERTQSEERLRRFVGDASHELRTPLTSIRGYAELFRRGAAERPEDLQKAMRRIEEEAQRMGVMVDDLLLLARLDQKRPIERQPVDLTRITADAVDDTRTVAPDRVIDYSPNGAIVVPGDEVRLRQVLANLLTNAVRHTPPDTPVHVQVTSDDTEAVIEVRDEGPGMVPEEATRVFERFWRADSSRARVSGGTGLGLAIVSAIAEAHGGRAEVLTAPGAGAAFRVHLPRRESEFAPPLELS